MKTLFCSLLVMCTTFSFAQYSEFTGAIRKLHATPAADVDKVWNELVESRRIPLVAEDSVAFLYRGEATTVSWMGDFNGWGYDKNFMNKGTQIPGTNLWILKASFPADARLDYKIILNGSVMILDPVNPHQQWSGVGGGTPNSELRMGRWQEDPITRPIDAIFHGRVLSDVLINSDQLGYQVMYNVYLPPSFKPASGEVYPILYDTDGYE